MMKHMMQEIFCLKPSKNNLIKTSRDKRLYNQLIKLYKDNPTKCATRLASKHKQQYAELREWVFEKTPKLVAASKKFPYKMLHFIIWVLSGLSDFPKCKNPKCKKRVGFKTNKNCFRSGTQTRPGYMTHCCRKCGATDPERDKKLGDSLEKHYGVRHQMKVKEIAQRAHETFVENCRKKIGCDSYFAYPPMRAHIQQLFDDLYDGNPMRVEKFKKKRVRTCLKKYGVTSVSKLPWVQLKRLETLHKKYGTCSYKSTRYMKDGIRFDSSWEITAYVFWQDLNCKIEREPVRLDFFSEADHKTHHSWPDFRVNGKLFEVKGNMHFKNNDPTQRMIYPYRKNKTRAFLKKMDQIAEDKHQCYIRNHVIYLTSVDIQPMHYAVSEKHGKDFIEQFKIQKTKT